MTDLDALLDRLEALLAEVEELHPVDRERTFELLDGIDALHRMALVRLGQALGPATVSAVRSAHPAIAWLFDAYDIGADHATATSACGDQTGSGPVRPVPVTVTPRRRAR